MARLRAGSFLRLTTPVRLFAHRFPFLLLVAATLVLIVIGRLETSFAERMRANVTDFAVPIVDLISRPVVASRALLGEISDLATLREENQSLRATVASLQQSKLTAERLASENKSLRALLNLVPEAPVHFVAARTIADSGNAFVRSVLIDAGRHEGVKRGDPVINGEGVVGRIAQLGNRASRVLLITDWNSRIPVLVESSREKAILAGDNTRHPRLRYLPSTAAVAQGDRIVTSGHGGVFPPGLPIGTVGSVGEDGIRIQPFVTWNRLEFVRVVNYGLKGALPDLPGDSQTKEALRK